MFDAKKLIQTEKLACQWTGNRKGRKTESYNL